MNGLSADVDRVRSEFEPERFVHVHRPECGLDAFIALDSTVLGPAAGGVRTYAYASHVDAARDACRLARSMTLKCALAGLDAGGGKAVVIDTGRLDRRAAFAALGQEVDALGGDFRTAGDLGTTHDDLNVMAETTGYVHVDVGNLAWAVGRGVVRCAEACADLRGRPGLVGLRVAVQGCGSIGSAVAAAFVEAGAQVVLADVDADRARRVADELSAELLDPAEILTTKADIVAPCAVGGVVDEEIATRIRAWAICGGANHLVESAEAERALFERGVLCVPDVISSAGAVIEGVGRTVMGLSDRLPLIDALGHTARLVLEDAAQSGEIPSVEAERRAQVRRSFVGPPSNSTR